MRNSMISLFAMCFLISVSALAQKDGDARVLRYAIVSAGQRAGSEVDTFSPDGRITSAFEFNDRGRGPKIEARYVVGSDGMPMRTDITGVDYLKAPVDEHFSAEGGQAQWKSTSEEGHAPAGRFYIAINSPALETALLAQKLVKAGTVGVKLFPAGEAHIEKLAELTLEDHGESMHVAEYAITGLAYTPISVWLDDQLNFFAQPGTWTAILREGWESTNAKLDAFTKQSDTDRYKQLALKLTRHPKTPLAIEHVRLYDSVHATMADDQTVVVSGDHIMAVSPAASAQVPANAEHIDGRGKTLLPGLFDMHAHAQPADGIMNIASGVTSIRDMGNDINDLATMQQQWQEGSTIGPRVSKAGLIDGRDPMQAPTGIFVTTQDEANAAVNHYADLGYIQTKVYSSLNPALLPEIIQVSHQRGMRVSGHIPNGITASQFVSEGADEIQHINFIFLNFLADKVKDTRTPERFTSVGQYARELDLHSKPVNDFIDLLLQHHTTVDVTLATFEGMFIGRPGHVSPDFAPVLDRLPAQIQRGAFTGGLTVTSANDQTYRDSWAAMLKMTKRMYDAGVPILAGTDATAGIMLHRELELEVQAGIAPLKALQNATFVAATVLKKQDQLGSIEPGKLADMVLVEGDPGANIADIRRCRTVIKNGAVFDSGRLYSAAGILPAK
ncbi:amidohydrolase family protein [Telmatobacter sp. DSM 110680]|uniref:Amidohydrolase family protein n=1 Tax=Telmatobacter sp. DSM 110680 TaxID=3036704 RepID=A0AAU7DRC3_9BACT